MATSLDNHVMEFKLKVLANLEAKGTPASPDQVSFYVDTLFETTLLEHLGLWFWVSIIKILGRMVDHGNSGTAKG